MDTRQAIEENFQKLTAAKDRLRELSESGELDEETREEIKAEVEDLKEERREIELYREIDAGLDDLEKGRKSLTEKYDDRARPVGSDMSWPEYLKAISIAGHRNPAIRDRDPRLKWFSDAEDESGHTTKDMAEGTGASGGFLVPTEFYDALQAVQGEDALVRPLATKIRIRRRQVNIPVLDQTDTTSGTPAWFGGMQGYWAEEAAQKTETDANFRQVSLVAHKFILYTRASDELVSDAVVSLGDFLTGEMGFAGAVTWYEDYSFLQGTGAGQPLGVLNAGCLKTVNREVASEVGYDDLVDMWEGLLPQSHNNAVWLAHPGVMSELVTIEDPNGNYIWQPNAREGLANTLLGRPVTFTEKLPTLGTTGDILLADFRYYVIGDRQATSIESTQYDRWRYDQTSYRCVHRVDGQPWPSTEFTLQDGSTTVSPFVALSSTVS